LAFDYSRLPHDFPRKYVPAGTPFDWENLSRIFDELNSRPIDSLAELQKWISDEDELNAIIYEQKALRLINYSRQTDNEEYSKEYTSFIQDMDPHVKVASFELAKKYVSAPSRRQLPRDRYGMADKLRENALSLFREANVPLEKQDAELAQEYQAVMGAMTVSFRGEDRTMQQMSKFLEETDRAVRQESWLLAQHRILRDVPKIDGVYSKLVEVRDTIGRNAGFANYRDFIFREKNRFDYTPEDCVRFHDAVEKHFVPLSRDIDRERMAQMGLDRLKPWDLQVDPQGRPPLAPFGDVLELVNGCARVFRKVDGQLSGYFQRMTDLELRDLASRKGKAPGGFQDDLAEAKLPFIFMNAANRDLDVRVLMHESGHSFQEFLMRDARLPFYYSSQNLPSEFAEVASTSMELIGGEHLEGTFYSDKDARRSNRAEVEQMIKLFTWVATIDAFQHWVYTHPGHSLDERAEAWIQTFSRFSGLESWENLEDFRRCRWQRQLHLFQFPFYYIEYGIATLGALGIWLHYRRDPEAAIASYKRGLSLGSSKPLPELFEAAGVKWGLGEDEVQRYAGELKSLLAIYA
jgi:oligoendopeptidase F